MSPGGIRTHNLRRRAAEDLRLGPRGHWDRPVLYNMYLKNRKTGFVPFFGQSLLFKPSNVPVCRQQHLVRIFQLNKIRF